MTDRRFALVALLPFKAHSERVKGKNFRPFAGQPLYRWMLRTLLEVEAIDLVVINTDGRALIEGDPLLDDPRVRLRDRRPDICGDFVSMNEIIADDMEAIDAQAYLMTHVTNPLLSRETLERAIKTFREGVADQSLDSLFSVSRVQSRFYRQDGTPINHDPARLMRTQDLEPWFEENSNFYIFTQASFARTGGRIGAVPQLFEVSKLEAVDIDDEADWVIAESLACASASNSNP